MTIHGLMVEEIWAAKELLKGNWENYLLKGQVQVSRMDNGWERDHDWR